MPASPKRCSMFPRRAVGVPLLGVVCAMTATAAAEPVAAPHVTAISAGAVRAGDDPQPVFYLLFQADRFTTVPGREVARSVDAAVPGGDGASGLVITRPAATAPLVPGSSLDVSMRASWTDGTLQDAPLVCCDEAAVYGSSGVFVITGGAATLERHADDAAVLFGTAPFTFTGVVRAFDRTTGAVRFEQEVRGSGTAHASVFAPDQFGYFYEISTLETAAPVPEPATAILIGLGAAGLAARRRRSRRWAADIDPAPPANASSRPDRTPAHSLQPA